MAKKRGLGRGLESLLSNDFSELKVKPGMSLSELPVADLQSGQYQPRQSMNTAALEELAQSIRAQGVVQPLVVRPLGKGYEIIAGERRWRAAQQAGLTTVPALVRDVSDQTAMAVALIENIQREALNPIDEAQALLQLVEQCKMTHAACAEAVGRSRTSITNLLRLLDLHTDVQEQVRAGQLSMGHARALLGVNAQQQSALANKVIDQQLTVRQTEKLVQQAKQPQQPAAPKAKSSLSKDLINIEQQLKARLSATAKIKPGRGGKGQVVLKYESASDLEQLLNKIK